MNSYPHEFLAHPQPLMFVAGLLPPPSSPLPGSTRSRSGSVLCAAPPPPPRDRAGSTATTDASSRRPSASGSLVEAESEKEKRPALTSPAAELPKSPPSQPSEDLSGGGDVEGGASAEEVERDREFEELVRNLRGALGSRGEKGKVWLGARERKDFRILLVDKGVRLPLRKVSSQPSSSAAPSSDPILPSHSPLSPLTPSSPLYPDGLIAPVWVRKHAELVPSVFVLFLRLYESPPTLEGGEDAVYKEQAKEREMDERLVREIGERRRKLGERGIKLTVVLMASAATLDSPALDPRLSYLRRASALSSKASLFVLTPVPADQLPDFVQSIQDALYDSALEYYSTHAKRVRRKRARVPSTPYGGTLLAGSSAAGGKALGSAGWAVRYDFKAGWFAEVRGDFEGAKRHYEDCWNELAKMFASTQTLPPRTKRWAEAKVLADCVAVRICRLYLYEGPSSKVLNPFSVHLKRFGDLSRGWGIGEETFEFWSWIARQYRIFAELLELALESGLTIPLIPIPSFPTAAPSPQAPPPPDYFATPTSASAPLQTVHPPAFYYYTAALCSIRRQERFDAEEEAGRASGYVSAAPGFANEKKVDHAALVIELFTKAYTLLKEQEGAHDRLALYVAYRIAETYCRSGQHEMAMRFFDRISVTFQRDRWDPIVRQIRGMWYECAQKTGTVDIAAKLLIEMMSPGSGVDAEERAGLQDDLLGLLRTTAPSSPEPIVLEMGSGSTALFNVEAGFFNAKADLGEEAAYQIALACPEEVDVSSLAFEKLVVSYTDDRPDSTVHASDPSAIPGADIVKLVAEGETTAALRWARGQKRVFVGKVQNQVEGEVGVSSVKLHLKEGAWEIQLVFAPELLLRWSTPDGEVTPVRELTPAVFFAPKPHAVRLEVDHLPAACTNESLPIAVRVISEDPRRLSVKLSAFLQPAEEDDGSIISAGSQQSSSLIKDVELPVLEPHQSVSTVIHLISREEGTKVVDLSLVFTLADTTAEAANTPILNDGTNSEEITHTAVVPVINPFECRWNVRYLQGAQRESKAVVSGVVRIKGPRAVSLEGLELHVEDDEAVSLISSSLDPMPPSLPQTWDHDTAYAFSALFSLAAATRPHLADTIPSPARLTFTWRPSPAPPSSDSHSTPSPSASMTTSLPLPPLAPPQSHSFISATLTHPPSSQLDTPFPLTLILANSHPTQPADDLAVQVDTAENFVWRGERSAAVGPVEPGGGTRALKMDVVGVGATGWVGVPGVRVWEGDGQGRREVAVDVQGGREVYVRP